MHRAINILRLRNVFLFPLNYFTIESTSGSHAVDFLSVSLSGLERVFFLIREFLGSTRLFNAR